MKISIIVPFGRTEGLLPELIQSINAQTVQPLELVIADPHYPARDSFFSNFNTSYPIIYADVPRSMGHRDHLRCRNAGAAQSSGDWLIFIDDDEIFLDSFVLERYAEAFRRVPIVKGYYVFFDDIDIKNDKVISYLEGPHPNKSETGPGKYPYHNLYGGNFGISRDLFLQIQGFDEFYDGGPAFTKSDIDLGLRALRASGLDHLDCPEGVAILHPTKIYSEKFLSHKFGYLPKNWLCSTHSRETPYIESEVDIFKLEGLERYVCKICNATGPVNCTAAMRKLMREKERVTPLIPYAAFT